MIYYNDIYNFNNYFNDDLQHNIYRLNNNHNATTEGPHASVLDLEEIPPNKRLDYDKKCEDTIKYNEKRKLYCYCLEFDQLNGYFKTYIYIKPQEFKDRKKLFKIKDKKILFKIDKEATTITGRKSINEEKTYENIDDYISKNKYADEWEFGKNNTEIKIYESVDDYINGECTIYSNEKKLKEGTCEISKNIRNYFDKKINNIEYDKNKNQYYYCLDYNESDDYFKTYIYLTEDEYRERAELFKIIDKKILFKKDSYDRLIGRSLNEKKPYSIYYCEDEYKDQNEENDLREFNINNKEIKVYESTDDYFKGKCKIFKNKYHYENETYTNCENIFNYYFDKYNNVEYDETKKKYYIKLDIQEYPRTRVYLTDEEYRNRIKLFIIKNKNTLFIKDEIKIIGRSVNGKTSYNNIYEYNAQNNVHDNKEFNIKNKEIKIYESADDYFNGKCKIFRDKDDFKNNFNIENNIKYENIFNYYFDKYPETVCDKKNKTCYCLDYDETDEYFKTYIYLTDHENKVKDSLFLIKNKNLLFKKNNLNNTLIGRSKNEQKEYKNFEEYYEQNKYEDSEEFNKENKEIKIYESVNNYLKGICIIFRNKDDYLKYLKNSDEKNKYYKICNNIRQYYKDKLNFTVNYDLKKADFFLEENTKYYAKEKSNEYKKNYEEYFEKIYNPSEYEIPENNKITSKKIDYFEKIFIKKTKKILKLIEIMQLYEKKDYKTTTKSKTEDLLININRVSLMFNDIFLHKCQDNINNLDRLKENILKILKENSIFLNYNEDELKKINDAILNSFEEYLESLDKEENLEKLENDFSESINDFSQSIEEYIATTEAEENSKKLENSIYNIINYSIMPKDSKKQNSEEYSEEYSEERDNKNIKDLAEKIFNIFIEFSDINNTQKNTNEYNNYLEYSKEELERLKNCFLKLYEITKDKLKSKKDFNFNRIYNEILEKLKLENIIKSNGVLAISKIYDERGNFEDIKLKRKDPNNCVIKYDNKNNEYIYILPFGNIIHVKKDEYENKNFNIKEEFDFEYEEKYYCGEIKEYLSIKDIQDKKCLLYNNILEFKKNKSINCENIDEKYKTKCDYEKLKNKKRMEKIKYYEDCLKNYLSRIEKDYYKIIKEYKHNDKFKDKLEFFLKDTIKKFSKTDNFIDMEDFIQQVYSDDITDEELKKEIEKLESFIENTKLKILRMLNSISKYFTRKLDDNYLEKIYNITNGEITIPNIYLDSSDYFDSNLKFKKNKTKNNEDMLVEYMKNQYKYENEIKQAIKNRIGNYKSMLKEHLKDVIRKCKQILEKYTENKQTIKDIANDELINFLKFSIEDFSENFQFENNEPFVKSIKSNEQEKEKIMGIQSKETIPDDELKKFIKFSINEISETPHFEDAKNFVKLIRDFDMKSEKEIEEINNFEQFIKDVKQEILQIIILVSKYFKKPINKKYLIDIYNITDDKIIIPGIYQIYNYYFCQNITKQKRYELEKENFKNQFEKYYNKYINLNLPEEINSPNRSIEIINKKFIEYLPTLINSKYSLKNTFDYYEGEVNRIKDFINIYRNKDIYKNEENQYTKDTENFLKQIEEEKNKKLKDSENTIAILNKDSENTITILENEDDIFEKVLFILNDIFKTIYKKNIVTEKNILDYNIKDLYNLKCNFNNKSISSYYENLGYKEKYRETFSIIRTIHKYREVAEYLKIFEEKIKYFENKINEIYDNFIDKNKNYSQKIQYLKNESIPEIYMMYINFGIYELKTQYLENTYYCDKTKYFIKNKNIENYFKKRIKEIKKSYNEIHNKLFKKIDEIAKIIFTDLNLKENSKILKGENAIFDLLELKGILKYLIDLTMRENLEYKNFKELYDLLFNRTTDLNKDEIFSNIKKTNKTDSNQQIENEIDITSHNTFNKIIFPEKETKKNKSTSSYSIKELKEIKNKMFEKIKNYEEYIENFYNFDFSNTPLEEKIIKQTTYLKNTLFYYGHIDTDTTIDELIKKYTTYQIFGKSNYISTIEKMYKLFYNVETYYEEYCNKHKSNEETLMIIEDIKLMKSLVLTLKENLQKKLNYVLGDVTQTIKDLDNSTEISQNIKNSYHQKYELLLKKLNEIINYDNLINKSSKKYLKNIDENFNYLN